MYGRERSKATMKLTNGGLLFAPESSLLSHHLSEWPLQREMVPDCLWSRSP